MVCDRFLRLVTEGYGAGLRLFKLHIYVKWLPLSGLVAFDNDLIMLKGYTIRCWSPDDATTCAEDETMLQRMPTMFPGNTWDVVGIRVLVSVVIFFLFEDGWSVMMLESLSF